MRNIILLGITSFFADVAGDMIIPILPFFFTKTLGLSVVLLGVIESSSNAVGILLQSLFGYASDKIRKRKIFAIGGYATAMTGKLLLALSTTWPVVLIGRLFDRSGKGIRTAPRDALIAASVPREKRSSMFGFHRMMDTSGAILGNIIAVVLIALNFSYRNIFWLTLIPAFIAILVLIPVKEKFSQQEAEIAVQRSFPHIKSFWTDRKYFGAKFWRFALVSSIFNLGNVGYAYLLLRAQAYGAGDELVPLLYLTFNVFQAVLSWPVGRIANKFGKEVLMLFGFCVFALMSWGFVFSDGIYLAFSLFALYGVFYAFNEVLSRSIVADLLPPEHRATGLGAYSTMTGLVLIPASLIGGLLWKFGAGSMTFLYSAIVATVACVIYAIFFLKIRNTVKIRN